MNAINETHTEPCRDGDDIRALLPDYLRRRLPPETYAAVRAHLSDCPDCAAAFEEERDFSALIGGTDAAPPAALFTGVMARVADEPRLPAFRPRLRDALLALAGTAAVIGMLFGAASLLAVLPPLAALTVGGLGLSGDWLAPGASLLLWVVPGLLVAAIVSLALHRTLVRREPTAE